jgi:hypothetical protein
VRHVGHLPRITTSCLACILLRKIRYQGNIPYYVPVTFTSGFAKSTNAFVNCWMGATYTGSVRILFILNTQTAGSDIRLGEMGLSTNETFKRRNQIAS